MTVTVSVCRAGRLKTTAQLDAAFKFFSTGGGSADAFAAATGIGIVVTEEQVTAAVKKVLEANKEALLTDRYRFNVGVLLGTLRTELKWADGKLMKRVMDEQVGRSLRARLDACTRSHCSIPR